MMVVAGITNAEYRCNKAEEELPDLVRRLSQTAKSVVAVVDPPRSGLHHKVANCITYNFLQQVTLVKCCKGTRRVTVVENDQVSFFSQESDAAGYLTSSYSTCRSVADIKSFSVHSLIFFSVKFGCLNLPSRTVILKSAAFK